TVSRYKTQLLYACFANWPGLLKSYLGLWRFHDAPILAYADGYDIAVDPRVVQQVLFEGNPALLAIELRFDLAHTELDIQVSDTLIQEITGQPRFYLLVPYFFGVQMQVLPETTGQNRPCRKLMTQLSRY